MIYEVKFDGDMHENAEFRNMLHEYGAEIIEERGEE